MSKGELAEMMGAAVVAAKAGDYKSEDTKHYLSTFLCKVKWDPEKQTFEGWKKGFILYCKTARVSKIYYKQVSKERSKGFEACETDEEARHYFDRSEQVWERRMDTVRTTRDESPSHWR